MPNIYVFDAYGTLFDVHSALATYRDEVGPDAERMSELWRSKQLEYTWVRTLAGQYQPFDALTRQSLDIAAARYGGLSVALKTKLLAAYEQLKPYDDVAPTLRGLQAAGHRIAIFSNGMPAMLETAINAAGLNGIFDAVLSVDTLKLYKTHPASYAMVTQYFGCEPGQIQFQSSNRWDIAGGKAFGFTCNWVNRSGAPDEYAELPPTRVLHHLSELLE